MDKNKALIEHFYSALKHKEISELQSLYAENAVFNDPVFSNLDGKQVRAMWEMLIKSGKDMRIEFYNVTGDAKGGTAQWDAYYTFSATGKKVVNRITAHFSIENGKIVKHTDSFSFYNWARQALGIPGLLLGWSSFIKDKIRERAKKNLESFMNP